MAYITSDHVKLIREELRKQFPKTKGWKFSITRQHYTSVNIDILEAPVRFDEKDYIQINEYYPEIYQNSEILKKIIDTANGNFLNDSMPKNYNNSDSQSDYFDRGWYVHISQGNWNKPFKQVTIN